MTASDTPSRNSPHSVAARGAPPAQGTTINHSDHAKSRASARVCGRSALERLLTLRVADTYPPEQASETHRRLEAGGTRGRLVIEFHQE